MRSFMILLLSFSRALTALGDEQNVEGDEQIAETEQAIKALIKLTRDESSTIRMMAYGALAEVADDSAEVTMALSAGTSDEDAEVRAAALWALLDLSGDDDLKASALITALSDTNEEVAKRAAQKLAELGQPAVKYLVDNLKKNERTKVKLLQVLSNFGPEAKDAVPALSEMAKDENDEVRALVVQCLSSICSKGPKLSELDPRIRSLIETAIKRYDTNSDGELDEEEQGAMRTPLDGADTDRNGRISRREFTRWYAQRYSSRTSSGFSHPSPRSSPFAPDPSPEPRR